MARIFNFDFDCAIFDMDGTILDSMTMWHTASDKYLASKGKTPETGLWDKVKWLNMNETVDYLIKTYGLEQDAKTVQEEINSQIIEEYEHNLQPKKGAEKLLRALNEKNVRCVLATATNRKCTLACIKRLGLEKYFTAVITCLDLNTSKSKPLIFEKAAELGKSDTAHSVVFEDALHALRTAHLAGFKTVAVYDQSDEEKTEPPETDWQRIIKFTDANVRTLDEITARLVTVSES